MPLRVERAACGGAGVGVQRRLAARVVKLGGTDCPGQVAGKGLGACARACACRGVHWQAQAHATTQRRQRAAHLLHVALQRVRAFQLRICACRRRARSATGAEQWRQRAAAHRQAPTRTVVLRWSWSCRAAAHPPDTAGDRRARFLNREYAGYAGSGGGGEKLRHGELPSLPSMARAGRAARACVCVCRLLLAPPLLLLCAQMHDWERRGRAPLATRLRGLPSGHQDTRGVRCSANVRCRAAPVCACSQIGSEEANQRPNPLPEPIMVTPVAPTAFWLAPNALGARRATMEPT